MHVCVVTACAHVLWPRPDIYCNFTKEQNSNQAERRVVMMLEDTVLITMVIVKLREFRKRSQAPE